MLNITNLFEPINFIKWDIYEYCNRNILKALINHPELNSEDISKLKNYKKKLCLNNLFKIKYKYSDKISSRVYPINGNGLTMFSKKIRNTICLNDYYDIDIINCAPSILLYICEELEIIETNYKNFKEYVLNRDDCIRKWNNYYETDYKQQILSILFNGKCHSCCHEDLQIIKSEIYNTSIIIKHKLKDIISNKKIKLKHDNELGSFMSLLIFNVESMIIDNLLSYLRENSNVLIYNDKLVFTYEFDGIKILKQNINCIDEFINNINSYIQQKYKYISFINKEYKEYLKISNELYEYNDINDSFINDEIIKKIIDFEYSSSDREIVKLIRKIYDTRILYLEKEKSWYFFDIHQSRWIMHFGKQPLSIKTILYDDILKFVNEYFDTDFFKLYKEIIIKYAEQKPVPNFLNKIEDINRIFTQLSSNKSINHILDYLMADSSYLQYNQNIEFDNNEFLLGFNNGVMDLKTLEFRKSRYEDFCSMSVGYNFSEHRDYEKESELLNIFQKIHPNKEILDLWLTMYSSMLCGLNIEKFFILQGRGRNGKGFMNEFISHTLGSNYIYYCEPSLLTNKFDTTSANPALANIHKKRGIIVKEMDNNDKIINSNIKTLTGGGFINCRMLYSNECQAKQCATVVCESNDEILLKSNPKQAELQRILVLIYKSSFLDNVEEDDAFNNIYKQNPLYKTIEWKNEYKMSLIYILLDYYKKFQENNYKFNIPEEIKDFSNKYLKKSSIMLSIFNEYFEFDNNSKIEFKTLLNRFKQFAYDNKSYYTFIQLRSINKENLIKTLEELNIKISGNNVLGIKIKDEYLEIEI